LKPGRSSADTNDMLDDGEPGPAAPEAGVPSSRRLARDSLICGVVAVGLLVVAALIQLGPLIYLSVIFGAFAIRDGRAARRPDGHSEAAAIAGRILGTIAVMALILVVALVIWFIWAFRNFTF
jgi:hypothetical protein